MTVMMIMTMRVIVVLLMMRMLTMMMLMMMLTMLAMMVLLVCRNPPDSVVCFLLLATLVADLDSSCR